MNSMTIIETLKYHEENQLNEWLDQDERISKKFLKALVKFSNANQSDIRQYCINTLPSEFSSLSIVYEALSEYSTDWNVFLSEEIERVVTLAKEKRINPEFMEVLTDIEVEDIYSKDEDIYIRMLDFMTSNLHPGNDKNFNIQLLDVIDWFLIEYDEDDDIPAASNWINKITDLANGEELSVKLKAREVLENFDLVKPLSALTFMEKIKRIFK